jgi:hypothetical protein
MKIDIDSYLYIIITIIILIITALGRRKRKPAQQVRKQPSDQPAYETGEEEQYVPRREAKTEQLSSDPFERLEQLFVPKEPSYTVQEEEPEPAQPEMDPNAEARRIKEMEEERRYQEEKQAEMTKAFRTHISGDLTAGSATEEEREISVMTLFDEPDDITKAIIYSEIFNRRV